MEKMSRRNSVVKRKKVNESSVMVPAELQALLMRRIRKSIAFA